MRSPTFETWHQICKLYGHHRRADDAPRNAAAHRPRSAVLALGPQPQVFTLGAIAIPRVCASCLDSERVRGIEPPFQAWEACVLPLNHIRKKPQVLECGV